MVVANIPLETPTFKPVYDWTGFHIEGEERTLETYDACAVSEDFTVTADYQLVVNPAYNADRVPVSIFSSRLHGEF